MLGKKAVHVEVANIFLGGAADLGRKITGSPSAVVDELKKLVATVTPSVAKMSLSEFCQLHNFAFGHKCDDPEITLRIMSGFHGGQHWIDVEKVKWDDKTETDYLW